MKVLLIGFKESFRKFLMQIITRSDSDIAIVAPDNQMDARLYLEEYGHNVSMVIIGDDDLSFIGTLLIAKELHSHLQVLGIYGNPNERSVREQQFRQIGIADVLPSSSIREIVEFVTSNTANK
ncbi:MAG: hypothetical protein WDZ88_02585 [Candidatus Paceibacterota bacterium]